MVNTMESETDEMTDLDYISTSGVYKTPFSLIILVQVFISSMIVILINLWFLNSLYFLLTGERFIPSWPGGEWWYWFLLPLNIYGNIFLFFALVMLVSAVIFRLLNWVYPVKEGIFEKGSKDWKYMHRRFWTAYFPIWCARAIPFPWSDIFVYRMFGVKIGKSVVAYEGYIDPELIEIGDNSMTSLNVGIFSHLIYHDKVVIKKVKISKNCIVGPHTITTPGTIIEEGAVLGANSYTEPDQVLEGNLIHIGTPATHALPITTVEESRKKAKERNSNNIE
ncbi:MAG: Acetyltransferase [Promethearchaeota archaeon]|nr:MAG: Acetyltransferase [Candidatus Lokiarchaeota archaeon]